ncbi:MAG: DNA-protecting protein DprA, partial [Coriobacteriales bacterium]|nr:DNA-protecting protein DprA [Coriobacteriales bacterium]
MKRHPNAFQLRLDDAGYPEQLRDVPDPPKVLYGIGDPDALEMGLAVIGARRSTPYGIRAAQLFAGWAGRAGYTVISGAARGCDQAAQQAVLDVDGRTVAVLGCGADVDYPASSARLLRRLRDGDGAVISEAGWGSAPLRWAFPRRNRIIAGLAAAVLVVEAGLPSGTFSTA